MHSLMRTTAGLAAGFVMAGSAAAADLTRLPDDGLSSRSVSFQDSLDVSQFGDITSSRTWTQGASPRINAGETFGARMIAVGADGGLFVLDDAPNGGFLIGQQMDGGVNTFTGADTFVWARQAPTSGGGVRVTVSQRSTLGGEILPAGLASGGGEAITNLRFDVGGFFAAADPLSYQGFSPSDVDSVQIALFEGGALRFVTFVTGTNGTIDLSGGLAATATVADVGGEGIDEVMMVFNLNVPTPGAASLFGLAGLAAVRRRRR